MTDRVDAIVVGGGVVGLAVGRALALAGHAPLILEGEADFGSWTSSRNSEVIHAGIYYPEGSLKARLCVMGKHMLYAFCVERGVPHRQVGKLIFAANDEQFGELEKIQAAAVSAGVNDLVWLEKAAVRAIEPELSCAGALLSPSTGIVDSHSLMQALLGEAEAHGGMLVANSPVERISRAEGLWQVHIPGEADPVVCAPILVNSAGLGAQALASAIEGLDPSFIPPLHLARGVYFTHSGKVPFSHLIYPVPEPGGLGTHLTLDLGGQARFGPDVEWIDRIDYTVDPARHSKFAAAAQRIWPALDPARLQPGYAGIRPKISGPGEAAADFMIQGPAVHGQEGLVNLFGIESPGLTASMAIAAAVMEALKCLK
ncbi:NAD(P)/FAD-dependent oxidoreductase [Novosphingobium cyanobacteriorum]|uniref:NAD(P)/FAD-dependent oxidoreductase n=1 Tax=Novosphingobium cyanobacteriorum TaxID=3024215 RepID=A0ABT6CN47_9SPHN|nr:NAD(P)/FAD-dependent oxidoreductase [Novosphingobium cyanobacteriorum]MDF8335277.1 NAD(P)/FAD-dependent oxidoreductase [Novosphingobium cyanobacteriorum]